MHVLVYSTSTLQAQQQRTARDAITRIAAAPRQARPAPVHGICLHCGAVETGLTTVSGTVDLAHIGESGVYPAGYGCEVCD